MKNTWKEEAKSEQNWTIFPSETEAEIQETQTSVQKSFFFPSAKTSIQSSTDNFCLQWRTMPCGEEEREELRVWKCRSFEKERNQRLIADRDTEMMMMIMMVMTTSSTTTTILAHTTVLEMGLYSQKTTKVAFSHPPRRRAWLLP